MNLMMVVRYRDAKSQKMKTTTTRTKRQHQTQSISIIDNESIGNELIVTKDTKNNAQSCPPNPKDKTTHQHRTFKSGQSKIKISPASPPPVRNEHTKRNQHEESTVVVRQKGFN